MWGQDACLYRHRNGEGLRPLPCPAACGIGDVVVDFCYMKSITVDTHKVIAALQRRGFTQEQAEGLVEAAREVDFSELATKADIRVIEARLNMLSVIGTGIFVAVIVNIIMGG